MQGTRVRALVGEDPTCRGATKPVHLSRLSNAPANRCPDSLVDEAPSRTSLVAQWLRIRLPMQGTRVRALVWEDPTCRGATKPVCHNY
ncbi:hypothetical protein J1605_009468 [Eschrichtius robustus]|uniref:Uncharacterized protein n=1 Tax=Eschrichtius robustus TaxID=9764 RepID=A0AB34GW64_ESCRO|nr:hypothetical protein J1605_009468 [Eschrichtius robustus]